MSKGYATQNDLLMNNLLAFYKNENNLQTMLNIINGDSQISLRIVDWFATNFAKKYYTVYDIDKESGVCIRFKVYNDYKLKLKAYSKKRFDPFCRWDRITIPYKDNNIQTTIGQLNFFKWALENNVIKYIEDNYEIIQTDMDSRNSSSRKKELMENNGGSALKSQKTRKKREELSILASKSIKKENVEIVVSFN